EARGDPVRRRHQARPIAPLDGPFSFRPSDCREVDSTMATPQQIEANRRNAQKSTGPTTPEGKDRSRFNALKHGMRARTPVLPGEDSQAFQQRVDSWTLDLKPRTTVEAYLVERAVRASWRLDRADRAETAHLTNTILGAEAAPPV